MLLHHGHQLICWDRLATGDDDLAHIVNRVREGGGGDDQGVQAPVVTNVAPKLDAEIFDGNVVLSTDTLAAASGLKPGDDLSNEKIAAAEQAIKAAYDASKQPVSALITNENKPVAGGKYDVIWHITETKVAPPKPKKDTSDSGAVSE